MSTLSGEREDFQMPGFGEEDEDIVSFVNHDVWGDWKESYRPYERQVEENIRMLSGRQWDTYLESVGAFVDLSNWFAAGDERWRQYPVFNWLLTYFKQTISKLTENVPAMGAVPGTADFRDARLAEVVEPIWKYQWDQMQMPEQMFDLYGWCVVAGRGILKQWWDPNRGPQEEFVGPAMLHVVDQMNQPRQLVFDNVPYMAHPDGGFVPHILGQDDGNGGQQIQLDAQGRPQVGDAYIHYLGDMRAQIVPPTAVRTPFGPEPFMHKAWYTHEYMMPVEEARAVFNRPDIEPDDITGEDDLLLKMQFGTNYGMPGSLSWAGSTNPTKIALRGHCRIREHWRRAVPNHPDLKYGRLTIVTKDEKLWDDHNPYVIPGQQSKAVIPFYAFDLSRFPFKQEGSSDLEFLNPVQRAINRRMGGLLDSVEYNEQPITIVNSQAGLDEQMDQLNRPGAVVVADQPPGGGEPVRRLPAVELPQSSAELLKILEDWSYLLGSTNLGSEGNPVTADASGELQREVRYDADRPWGATLRKHSYIWARVAEDMNLILGVCMDDDRLLTLSGQDNAWKFLSIKPEMFQGRVHIRPMPESAVLESRQDKQNRILNFFQLQLIDGATALQTLGYPDINRLMRPGAEAYELAQRENAEMTMGMFSPVLLEHDHMTHLTEHKKVQQTVEYRNYPPQIQNIFRLHIFMHEQMLPAQAIHNAQVMAPAVAAQGALAASASGQPAGPAEGAQSNPPQGK